MTINIDEYLSGWAANELGLDRNDLSNAGSSFLLGFDDYEKGVFALDPANPPGRRMWNETTGDYTERIELLSVRYLG